MKKGIFWGFWTVLALVVGTTILLPKYPDPLLVKYGNMADFSWIWWVAVAATLAQILLFGIMTNRGPDFYLYMVIGSFCVAFLGATVIVLLTNGIAFPMDIAPPAGAGLYLASALVAAYTGVEANEYFKPKRGKKK